MKESFAPTGMRKKNEKTIGGRGGGGGWNDGSGTGSDRSSRDFYCEPSVLIPGAHKFIRRELLLNRRCPSATGQPVEHLTNVRDLRLAEEQFEERGYPSAAPVILTARELLGRYLLPATIRIGYPRVQSRCGSSVDRVID